MIREAEERDCTNLAALSIHVWLHTYATDGIREEISRYVQSTFTPEYFQAKLLSPGHRIFVEVSEPNLLGYILLNLESRCAVDPSRGYEVETLYVSPHFQRRSIGTQLLKRSIESFGAPLWLSAWVRNEAAIGFYKAFGFTDIGTTFFEMEGERHENRVLAHDGTGSGAAATE